MENVRPAIADGNAAANAHLFKDKMPNLDGVRAFACLFVVISHMPWPTNIAMIGSVGVGVFFVLSGFLMSYLYVDSGWDRRTVMKYSIARFSRIAPIYWLVISVCVILTQFESSEFPLRIEGVVELTRHYLFSGNVSIFWSIPLEVQYYIFFIFIWWCIAFRFKFAFASFLLILVCATIMLTHNYWPNLSVPNKLHFFLAGTIAGALPRKSWDGPLNRLMLTVLQLASMAVIGSAMFLYDTTPALYDSVEISFAFGIAIYLLSINSSWTNVLFALPWMRKIGQASFSIYLIHTLVFYYGAHLLDLDHKVYQTLWIPLGVAAVIIPMIISHYVEMPLQRITRQFLDSALLSKSPRRVPQVA